MLDKLVNTCILSNIFPVSDRDSIQMITFYYWLGTAVIIIQFFSVLLVLRNGLYSLSKYRKVRSWYRPKTVLIVPCKGIDLDFEKNITSFFEQDFNNYLLWFVVESEDDPAYETLHRLKNSLGPQSPAPASPAPRPCSATTWPHFRTIRQRFEPHWERLRASRASRST